MFRTALAALLALVWAACGGSSAAAQDARDAPVDPLEELAVCEGEVPALLLATKTTIPGADTEDYVVPPATRLNTLRASIGALLSGDPNQARADARTAGYGLCREGTVVLYRPLVATEGGASFAWRTVDARPVIVEAPHSIFDDLTLEQAVGLFESLDARAIILGGVHRCANRNASPCSGVTTACSGGTNESYRESDMAHVKNSFYHRAHVALAEHYADDLVLAVHGSKDDGISLSDGTTLETTADAPVARLAKDLTRRFEGSSIESEPITTCNEYPDGPEPKKRLCGTTDVQGRHLNGSAGVCTVFASAASGRFLHMEQSHDVRRDQAAIVGAALNAVVPAH